MEQTLRMVSDKCRDWPNPEYQIISKKLRVLEDKFAEEIVNVSKYDETEFCVLNHGDCWTNNIMFREDENGKPIEVRLVRLSSRASLKILIKFAKYSFIKLILNVE